MSDAENNATCLRIATRADVPAIVEMLADDALGAKRERFESPLPACYLEAFAAIDRSEDNHLLVAERSGEVIGVLQLTIIQYLTYQGGRRALVEGVRVRRDARKDGLGRKMFEWAIAKARELGCHLVQLTTDKQRPDAHAFYEALGFVASHEGMKLHLS
ncbi:GNAT family N-acetyltransferase [Haliangium ochraceum]|uniref:GCN5-related N-acetyltransferase n=1 Tax=Haliangium ochraceum (strain DSM 14365 / JCM 11303 / SMP-2) TaxID=502025 RepID=D0LLD7_HALO1|nr:GNAT family N-acetyltransferase [Haliangium ochraceum]ACY18633.1 GCN5-related N-acetyltransferase [Haliangium ochraceum DSM 14365]